MQSPCTNPPLSESPPLPMGVPPNPLRTGALFPVVPCLALLSHHWLLFCFSARFREPFRAWDSHLLRGVGAACRGGRQEPLNQTVNSACDGNHFDPPTPAPRDPCETLARPSTLSLTPRHFLQPSDHFCSSSLPRGLTLWVWGTQSPVRTRLFLGHLPK